MISLLYLSSATTQFSDSDLVNLLAEARKNNTQLDISGMLLYHDGNFLQVLEGPDDQVRHLFEKISGDERHQSVVKLIDRPIAERQFGEWSMAFRTTADAGLDTFEGYSNFLNNPFSHEVKEHPSAAYQFLLAFRESAR